MSENLDHWGLSGGLILCDGVRCSQARSIRFEAIWAKRYRQRLGSRLRQQAQGLCLHRKEPLGASIRRRTRRRSGRTLERGGQDFAQASHRVERNAASRIRQGRLKGVDYRLALASVVEGAASSSPEAAAALLAGENELILRSVLIDSLVSGAIDAHSDFLAEWTAALPLGNDRDKAISSLVEEWSMKATTV